MANPFAASINVGSLGTGGFKIQGQTGADRAGFAVSTAGDVNGDGVADLLVGTNGTGPNQAAYVVYGDTSGFGALVDLDAIAVGISGLSLTGAGGGDYTGSRVAAAGDVNRDGFADFIVGAGGNDSGGLNAGAAYVVFGAARGSSGGFKIQGENAGDDAGKSVAGGDFNGDGFSDVLVGAPNNDAAANDAGSAYVVFGQRAAFPTVVNLDDVALGSGGFRLTGPSGFANAGRAVASAGDVNGDRITDLIVGAPNGGGNAWIVYGRTTGFPAASASLDSLATGTSGFKIAGGNRTSVGYSVAGAGDVNGDGFGDVIVGAQSDNEGGQRAGAAYVVFGAQSRASSTINIAALAAGTGGFKIIGENADAFAGNSAASAGDVNGDGLADLIIGAHNDEGGVQPSAPPGAAYVVFGRAGGFTAPVRLDDVALGTGGFKIVGEGRNDHLSQDVVSAADVNNDGLSDLIVGARFNDSGGGDAGAAYVIFGKKEGNSTGDDSVGGTAGVDDINLGSGKDYFNGFAGNDRIQGGAGADFLRGAGGDDTFRLGIEDLRAPAGSTVRNTDMRNATGFADAVSVTGKFVTLDILDGGDGNDRVEGTGSDDVVVFSAPGSDVYGAASRTARIVSVETFDLGDGNDVLSLTTTSAARYTTNVTANGGSGDDVLWTGSGNDRLNGGIGNDNLVGSYGDDILDGGSGADLFGFAPGFGRDTVGVFNPAQGDRLRLKGFGDDLSSFANLQASGAITTTFEGPPQFRIPTTTIDLGSTQIVLPFFNGADLTAGMFQFVP